MEVTCREREGKMGRDGSSKNVGKMDNVENREKEREKKRERALFLFLPVPFIVCSLPHPPLLHLSPS